MPIPYTPDAPDLQSISVVLPDSGARLDRGREEYDFASDFLTPTDSFSLRIGIDEKGLTETQRSALKFGARVRLRVQDNILASGRIDSIDVAADPRSGTTIEINGRDPLGQTLDTVADPTYKLPNGGTLAELLKHLFAPFGWSDDSHFEIDNRANRNARTGVKGVPMTKGGKRKGPRPLKSFVLHQTKPYNHESVFHFASRVSQRHGLWIWCSADGEKLIVGKPDFDQEPIFSLRRSADGTGNIMSGTVSFNMTDQPSIIIADGFVPGGSGEFGKGRVKSFIVNPLLGLTSEGDYTAEVQALLKKFPGTKENTLASASFPFKAANIPFRPMFLHDDESKTSEQLDAFVKREMSLLYRKALTANFVVHGHGQTVGGAFVAWAPDTVVDVYDGISGLSERMYVLGVRFSKSRRAGTTTSLHLVRLNSIDF